MSSIPESLIQNLKRAKKLVFFTGAGISAESGIPTFRGKDGIWNKLSPEELANFNAFLKNPSLVWDWYQHRKTIIHATRPNAGHFAIAELQNYFDVTVITQNVDNLHSRAGSKNILELHGNIERNFCIKCKKMYDILPNLTEGEVPHCNCGGLIRPDVVWFGENLPYGIFEKAEEATANCDIFISVGTMAVVYPAAYLPQSAATQGIFSVEINIAKTDLTPRMNVSFQAKSGDILPLILEEVKKTVEKN